jgi:hypothetical protein
MWIRQFAIVGLMGAMFPAMSEEPQPYGGKAHVIPGVIEAENFDEGGPGVAYVDREPENQGEKGYRGESGVDIEKRSDASNGHGIGWTRTGEWLIYTVEVKEAGSYTIEFPVASHRPGGLFHLEIDGVDLTGPIRVPDTGGWDKLQTIRKEGVKLEAGTFRMKLVMDKQGLSGSIGDIDLMRFVREP